MRLFRNTSIRGKLQHIMMLTSGVTLLLASGAFMAQDVLIYRKTLQRDLSSLVQVIGINSTGALVFDDRELAARNLGALRVKQHVEAACLYDRAGKLFASYHRPGEEQMPILPAPGMRSPVIREGDLLLAHPVVHEGNVVGTLCLRYSLGEIGSRLKQSAVIVAAIVTLAFLAAFLLALVLQRFISAPLRKLAGTARTISEGKDYAVRARIDSGDEIGQLSASFDEMVDSLCALQETLEDKVRERTLELQAANTRLRHIDEMKTSFLTMVSHELRTPLTSVVGFAHIIRDCLEETILPCVDSQEPRVSRKISRTRENLQIIVSEGERLTALIDNILDIEKMNAGMMEWDDAAVSLSRVIERAREAVGALFERKGLELAVDVAPGLPVARGDESRLVQVMINLLSNALNHTDRGTVTCTAAPASGGIFVSVRDTGSGIPLEAQAGVFEKYRQAGPGSAAGGTGLGLVICREIVEHHGGTIWFESEPGQGSTFFFTLPTEGDLDSHGADAGTEEGAS